MARKTGKPKNRKPKSSVLSGDEFIRSFETFNQIFAEECGQLSPKDFREWVTRKLASITASHLTHLQKVEVRRKKAA